MRCERATHPSAAASCRGAHLCRLCARALAQQLGVLRRLQLLRHKLVDASAARVPHLLPRLSRLRGAAAAGAAVVVALASSPGGAGERRRRSRQRS